MSIPSPRTVAGRRLPPRPSRDNAGGVSRDQLVAQLKNLLTEDNNPTNQTTTGDRASAQHSTTRTTRTASQERQPNRRRSMPTMGVGIKHINPPGRENSPSPPDNIKPRSRIPTPTGTSAKIQPQLTGPARRNSTSRIPEPRRSSSAAPPLSRSPPQKEETQKRETNSDPESNPQTHTGAESPDESFGSHSHYPRKPSVVYRGQSALPPHMLLNVPRPEPAHRTGADQSHDEIDHASFHHAADDTLNNADQSFALDPHSEIHTVKTENSNLSNTTRYSTAHAQIVSEAYSIIGKYFPEKRLNMQNIVNSNRRPGQTVSPYNSAVNQHTVYNNGVDAPTFGGVQVQPMYFNSFMNQQQQMQRKQFVHPTILQGSNFVHVNQPIFSSFIPSQVSYRPYFQRNGSFNMPRQVHFVQYPSY